MENFNKLHKLAKNLKKLFIKEYTHLMMNYETGNKISPVFPGQSGQH